MNSYVQRCMMCGKTFPDFGNLMTFPCLCFQDNNEEEVPSMGVKRMQSKPSGEAQDNFNPGFKHVDKVSCALGLHIRKTEHSRSQAKAP